MRPKAALAWSSGKDSAMALLRLREAGAVEVTTLLTTVSEGTGRIAMHGTARALLEAQAEAAGLPLLAVPIPEPAPTKSTRPRWQRPSRSCTTTASRSWRSAIFSSPIFALIARAASPGPEWRRSTRPSSGATFDAAFLAALPPGVDPCGERGEFHSFVHDGPIFARPVPLRRGGVMRDARFAYADLGLASP